MKKLNIFWFRRDLRVSDNHGLAQALAAGLPVVPIFIFDKHILGKLPKEDHRVTFIHDTLIALNKTFEKYGSGLRCYFGEPQEVFKNLLREKEWEIDTVFTNHDYEPYAFKRDQAVEKLLGKSQVQFQTFKDQVIFEKNEVVKDDGKYYTVFTPYSKKWLKVFETIDFKFYPSEKKLEKLAKLKGNVHSLEEIGFKKSSIPYPKASFQKEILKHYKDRRDFPALDATSKLGLHLRFGTVSVRECVAKAKENKSAVWLSELIWREFFMQILWHNPYVLESSFKEKYDKIKWRNNEEEFKAWCEGRTGYPIVDAGMRELNETGFMHNRVRMITASFLVKHLLIDWRWGERYFAEKLFDYDLSANNGNWQWVAGSGCDAAPYFRIFNPLTQTAKFDKDNKYIKKWIPELKTSNYPGPMVVHEVSRARCLKVYKEAVQPS